MSRVTSGYRRASAAVPRIKSTTRRRLKIEPTYRMLGLPFDAGAWRAAGASMPLRITCTIVSFTARRSRISRFENSDTVMMAAAPRALACVSQRRLMPSRSVNHSGCAM